MSEPTCRRDIADEQPDRESFEKWEAEQAAQPRNVNAMKDGAQIFDEWQRHHSSREPVPLKNPMTDATLVEIGYEQCEREKGAVIEEFVNRIDLLSKAIANGKGVVLSPGICATAGTLRQLADKYRQPGEGR